MRPWTDRTGWGKRGRESMCTCSAGQGSAGKVDGGGVGGRNAPALLCTLYCTALHISAVRSTAPPACLPACLPASTVLLLTRHCRTSSGFLWRPGAPDPWGIKLRPRAKTLGNHGRLNSGERERRGLALRERERAGQSRAGQARDFDRVRAL